MRHRKAAVERKTKETQISLRVDLDGKGMHSVTTGLPFFDHMLTLLAFHGSFDLFIEGKGDVNVDAHHTVEDVGICFGEALLKALGEAKGIRRYGSALLPMDEALASVVVDLSMRPCLVYNFKPRRSKIGSFDVELVEEFFKAVTTRGRMTLHINLLYGKNTHHMVEAVFKGFGRALREAVCKEPGGSEIPSSKGLL